MTGENVILEGIRLPQMARLEVAGAPEASFEIFLELPEFLGGVAEPKKKLVRFVRTEEVLAGLPVFRPAD